MPSVASAIKVRLCMGAGSRVLTSGSAVSGRLALNPAGKGSRVTVDRQDEECRSGAEIPACYTVVAGPTAVLILNSAKILTNGCVPPLPFFSPLGRQTFSDAHVTEKLLSAIGTESLDEAPVSDSLNHDSAGIRQVFPVSGDAGERPLGRPTFLFALGLELLENIALARPVCVLRVLHGSQTGGAGVQRHAGGSCFREAT